MVTPGARGEGTPADKRDSGLSLLDLRATKTMGQARTTKLQGQRSGWGVTRPLPHSLRASRYNLATTGGAALRIRQRSPHSHEIARCTECTTSALATLRRRWAAPPVGRARDLRKLAGSLEEQCRSSLDAPLHEHFNAAHDP